MTGAAFLHREIPALRKRVHRLGLAASFGIDEAGIQEALDAGLNYVFYTRGVLERPVREALRRDRERLVIATGPVLGWFRGSIRRAAEKRLRALGTDYLDVFQLYWLSRMSAWTPGNVEELLRLREEGKVRALGVSIHDRPRAGKLAESSPLDQLMIRYNAAHPGAERDIFPHMSPGKPTILAYTATAWRKLLKRPSGWTGPVMTAGDCYRFQLSNPHVDLAWTGPANREQLEENLKALEKGPLTDDEQQWMRAFGKAAHG